MNEIKETLPTAKEMIPLLVQALEQNGGRATVRQLEELVAKLLRLSPQQLAIGHDKSRSEFQYRLGWTRTYAKKQGLALSIARNQWALPGFNG